MKYLDYQERRKQGTFHFPVAFYHVDQKHPRYLMPYHWHPEYEIIRILEGTFSLTINNTCYSLKKGDLVFIQDGMLHGGTPVDCVYECVVFDMKLLLKENHVCVAEIEGINEHTTLINRIFPANDLYLQYIINELFTSMRERKSGYEFTVQGSLYLLLGAILEKKLYSTRSSNELQMSVRLKQVKHVLSFIEEHYTENITLDDMADIAGMNPKYFCRFFKQITQKTPINYLNYYRIECAREQLSITNHSITEVALSCGFNDISYFIKTFKKQMGITPKQYIKQKY